MNPEEVVGLQDIEPEADVTGAQGERNNQSNVVSFQDHVA